MRRLTDKEFEQKIKLIHGDKYIILSSYVNSRTEVKVLCTICSFIWHTKSIRKGHGCPQCGREKASSTTKWNITQEKFLSKIPESLLDKIDILEIYTALKDPILVKCKTCARKWESKAVYLYKGHGCDSCSRKEKGLNSRIKHEDYLCRVKSILLSSNIPKSKRSMPPRFPRRLAKVYSFLKGILLCSNIRLIFRSPLETKQFGQPRFSRRLAFGAHL